MYFNRRGTGSSLPDPWTDIQSKITVDYFEVPLLIKVRLADKSKIRPHLIGGAYGALKTGAKEHIEYGGQEWTVDMTGDIRKFDYGLVLGAGLDIDWGKRGVLIDVRYDLGLAKINSFPSRDDWKNRSVPC